MYNTYYVLYYTTIQIIQIYTITRTVIPVPRVGSYIIGPSFHRRANEDEHKSGITKYGIANCALIEIE